MDDERRSGMLCIASGGKRGTQTEYVTTRENRDFEILLLRFFYLLGTRS
jgi:hypothetical protein